MHRAERPGGRPWWRLPWRLLRLVLAARLPVDRHLLARHLRAYGELAAIEGRLEWAAWRRRAVLLGIALVAACAAAAFAGVALMLWAVVPASQGPAPWLLWAVPLLPALVALTCLQAARAAPLRAPFAGTRRQLAADLALWHKVVGEDAAPDAVAGAVPGAPPGAAAGVLPERVAAAGVAAGAAEGIVPLPTAR